MCDIYLLSVPNRNIDYPALSLPTLTGRLKKDGFTVVQSDINIIIRDKIITENCLSFMCEILLPNLIVSSIYNSELNSYFIKLNSYLNIVKMKWGFRKVQQVKEKMQQRRYVELLQSQEGFDIVLAIFRINRMIHNYIEYYTYHDEQIKKIYKENNSQEPISQVISETIEDILQNSPFILGLTVLEIQRNFALFFIKKIRSKFKGKIVVGGADPTRFEQQYIKYFDGIDYVLLKEGEDNLSKLLSEVKNETFCFSNINGIIYRESNSVIFNPPKPVNICRFTQPDFDGICLNKYLTPILPVHASRACYWALENAPDDPEMLEKRGCRFCAHYKTYSTYYERTASEVVTDMEVLYKKYGTTQFHLTDDALKPTLGVAICDELKRRGLNEFKWLVYARLEKSFTLDVLKKWYDGGVRVIEWGLETASQKILNAMNKAVNVTEAQRILDDSNSVGILNKLFMFHNYPGETVEDLKETLNFLLLNTQKRVIRPFPSVRNKMFLLKNTSLYNCADREYLFKKVWKPSGDFSVTAAYVDIEEYTPKIEELKAHLDEIKQISYIRRVFQTDDENVMLDLVVIELNESGTQTYYNVK